MVLDPETRARIIDLYREGEKINAITDETGAARSSIYHVLAKAGVRPTRVRGGGPPTEPITDHDLQVQVTDVEVGSQLIDALLRRVLECEREIGRLQALLATERSSKQHSQS